MEMNLLKILFFNMTVLIIIIGILINVCEKRLPVIFPQMFRYEKFGSLRSKFEVPKRWFKHFYVFSSLHSLFGLYSVINVYMYGAAPSPWLVRYLDFFAGSNRHTESKSVNGYKCMLIIFGLVSLASSTAVIIALTLFTFHSLRRFYETWFVSVFSDGKFHFVQYYTGFLYYWGVITIILAEAVGFDKSRPIGREFIFSPSFFQILGTLLFAYAWINQYKAGVILANLRKNSKGEVVTTEHRIPYGGLFKYVSSPHRTCEILIYVSLWLILFNNHTFKHVLFFVISNQVETSLLNHWWYLKTFKDYPKERKVIVPFVF